MQQCVPSVPVTAEEPAAVAAAAAVEAAAGWPHRAQRQPHKVHAAVHEDQSIKWTLSTSGICNTSRCQSPERHENTATRCHTCMLSSQAGPQSSRQTCDKGLPGTKPIQETSRYTSCKTPHPPKNATSMSNLPHGQTSMPVPATTTTAGVNPKNGTASPTKGSSSTISTMIEVLLLYYRTLSKCVNQLDWDNLTGSCSTAAVLQSPPRPAMHERLGRVCVPLAASSPATYSNGSRRNCPHRNCPHTHQDMQRAPTCHSTLRPALQASSADGNYYAASSRK